MKNKLPKAIRNDNCYLKTLAYDCLRRGGVRSSILPIGSSGRAIQRRPTNHMISSKDLGILALGSFFDWISGDRP